MLGHWWEIASMVRGKDHLPRSRVQPAQQHGDAIVAQPALLIFGAVLVIFDLILVMYVRQAFSIDYYRTLVLFSAATAQLYQSYAMPALLTRIIGAFGLGIVGYWSLVSAIRASSTSRLIAAILALVGLAAVLVSFIFFSPGYFPLVPL
jgi:uncharacterized membrane protein YuzA (DUF378 family)